MISSAIEQLLVVWIFAALLMATLWMIQRSTKNAGIVDIGWAAAIAVMSVFFSSTSHAPVERRLLIGAMGLLWGARLAIHLLIRNRGRPEDGRYTQLRKDWAPNEQLGLFKFFQFQAVAAVFFSIPFLLSSLNQRASLTSHEIAGFLLWAIALVGETVSDFQLERFKRSKGGISIVCQEGLWRYSRHPNYFFESLVWIALALFAWPSPAGFIALACPALIIYFIFNITGIPATEAQALRTKGDHYREYQRKTSAFFPWFPEKESNHVVRTSS